MSETAYLDSSSRAAAADAGGAGPNVDVVGVEVAPGLALEDDRVRLYGRWTAAGLIPRLRSIEGQLVRAVDPSDADAPAPLWQLDDVERLDRFGALLLWRAWGEQLPEGLALPKRHRASLESWRDQPIADAPVAERDATSEPWHARLRSHGRDALALLGELALELGAVALRPQRVPWREISAAIHRIGARALPITGLVGIFIGVVISYLSSLQLRRFGADSYIVRALGIGVVRELGPLLASLLVAGRSGSAITAELGLMRVNEELDAMATLGISRAQRLLLPRVLALLIVLPLVVVWVDVVALAGGAIAAQTVLDMRAVDILAALPGALPPANYWIGLSKAVVFGLLIGMTACHYGFRVRPDAASLGAGTTSSVVTSITLVIVANGLFAVALREVGL